MKLDSIGMNSFFWKQYRGGSPFLNLLQLAHKRTAVFQKDHISKVLQCNIRPNHITLIIQIRLYHSEVSNLDDEAEVETLLIVLDRLGGDFNESTDDTAIENQVDDEDISDELVHWLETPGLFVMRLDDTSSRVIEASTFSYHPTNSSSAMSLNPFAPPIDQDFLILLLHTGVCYLWKFQYESSSWSLFGQYDFTNIAVDITRPRRSLDAIEPFEEITIQHCWIDEVENRIVLIEENTHPHNGKSIAIVSHRLFLAEEENLLYITPAFNMKFLDSISTQMYKDGILFVVGQRKVRLETDIGECVVVMVDFRSGKIRHSPLTSFVEIASEESSELKFLPMLSVESHEEKSKATTNTNARAYLLVGEWIVVFVNDPNTVGNDCRMQAKVKAPSSLLKAMHQGASLDISILIEEDSSFVIAYLVDNEYVQVEKLTTNKTPSWLDETVARLPIPKTHFISNMCSGNFLTNSCNYQREISGCRIYRLPILNLYSSLFELQILCNEDQDEDPKKVRSFTIIEVLLALIHLIYLQNIINSMFPIAKAWNQSTDSAEGTEERKISSGRHESYSVTNSPYSESFYQHTDDFIRTLMKIQYENESVKGVEDDNENSAEEAWASNTPHWLDQLDVVTLLPAKSPSFTESRLREIVDPSALAQIATSLVNLVPEVQDILVNNSKVNDNRHHSAKTVIDEVKGNESDSSLQEEDEEEGDESGFLKDVNSDTESINEKLKEEEQVETASEEYVVAVDHSLDHHLFSPEPGIDQVEQVEDAASVAEKEISFASEHANLISILLRAILCTHPHFLYEITFYLMDCQNAIFSQPQTWISEQLAMKSVVTDDYIPSRRSTPDLLQALHPLSILVSSEPDQNVEDESPKLEEVLFFKAPENRLSFPKPIYSSSLLLQTSEFEELKVSDPEESTSYHWTEVEQNVQRAHLQESKKALKKLINKMAVSSLEINLQQQRSEDVKEILGGLRMRQMSTATQDQVIKLLLLCGDYEAIATFLMKKNRHHSLVLFCIRLFASWNYLVLERDRHIEIRRRSSTTSQKGKARISLTSLIENAPATKASNLQSIQLTRTEFYMDQDYYFYDEGRGKLMKAKDLEETEELTLDAISSLLEERKDTIEKIYFLVASFLLNNYQDFSDGVDLVKSFLRARPLGMLQEELVQNLESHGHQFTQEQLQIIELCLL